MTFIAVATTPWFVFLSCDLRITTLVAGSIESQSDWAMKSTLLDADEMLGFTGLARIGDRLTDEWLVDTLIGVAPSLRLAALADKATSTFRNLDVREPQAFLGVGFHPQGKNRSPHAWVVTNAWDDVERAYDPRMFDSRFSLYPLNSPLSRLTSLWTVGGEDENGSAQHPAVQEGADAIEQLIRQDRTNPRAVMDRLALLNQQMTSLGDHIGASAVVTSLPRMAAQNTGMVMWLDEPNRQAFTRFPISVNYVSDFRGPHPEYFRQPGLISSQGFGTVGAVSSNQTAEIGPDPHRGPTGDAFGIRRGK